jgi:hypothetical protein
VRVVRRLARPREVDPDLVHVRPEVERSADEFRTVVAEDRFWRSSTARDALEHCDDMLALQAPPDLDRQAFLGEDIHHRQSSEARSAHELVRDEIHAPGLVGHRGNAARLAIDHGTWRFGRLRLSDRPSSR